MTNPLVRRAWAPGFALLALLATVVVAILLVGGPSRPLLVSPSSTAEPSSSPSQRIGLLGLPPPGAAPSEPAVGELVFRWSATARSGSNPAGPCCAQRDVYFFADGRLIWEFETNLPFGASNRTTGLLEQRLTPEGAEIVRSRIEDTRLFDGDPDLFPTSLFSWGVASLRVDGVVRTIEFGRPPPDPESAGRPAAANRAHTDALRAIAVWLAEPEVWLAPGPWVDRGLRAFVPSRYGICLDSHDADRAALLLALPSAARDLLDRGGSIDEGPGCLAFSTDDARTMIGLLEANGFDPTGDPYLDGYRKPGSDETLLTIHPILPDGSIRWGDFEN